MIIKQINQKIMLNDIKNYVESLATKRIDKTTLSKIKNTVTTVKYETLSNALYIECTTDEIDNLLEEYLKMVGSKYHLLILSFFDKLCSVYSVAKTKEACKIADYYDSFPADVLDDSIRLYVGYLKNTNGVLDVDYALKVIL